MGKQFWFYWRRISGLSKVVTVLMLGDSILTVEEGHANTERVSERRNLSQRHWKQRYGMNSRFLTQVCVWCQYMSMCMCARVCQYVHTPLFPPSLHGHNLEARTPRNNKQRHFRSNKHTSHSAHAL